MRVLAGCVSVLLTVFVVTSEASEEAWRKRFTGRNMNGLYKLSKTPHQDISKFPKEYRDYPGGAEYFDVYSPTIQSLYSQVFWKGLPPVDIPQRIQKRFDNKVMAVIGFEVDQVRVDENGNEVSVPINVAYNHHFESAMVGKKSKFVRRRKSDPNVRYRIGATAPDVAMHAHGLPDEFYEVVDISNGDHQYPTRQKFGAANGGEYRKSFHGFPPGHAKLIESPQKLQITPMQIDTWHREKMNISGGPFVAGPLPRNSLASKDAPYSGLLECPVTTRITKELDVNFEPKLTGTCRYEIKTFQTCKSAVEQLEFPDTTTFKYSQNNGGMPGCSLKVSKYSDSGEIVEVSYNAMGNDFKRDCNQPQEVLFGAKTSFVQVHLSINEAMDNVEITLKGPADVWFGVGFGAQAMKDEPWAVVVDGNGEVSEHQLHDQGGGSTHDELPRTVEMLANSVNGATNIRTVVLRRSLKGKLFTFNPAVSKIPFINAIGSTVDLHYHKEKEPSSLYMMPLNQSVCMCSLGPTHFGSVHGKLAYKRSDNIVERVRFPNRCLPYPRTDLLEQRNPTCDIRTYSGGQIACHHMWSLLDADQEIPWQDRPLVYRLKFRFWFQEYKENYRGGMPSHKAIFRTTWGIGSPVEYDVPKCSSSVPGCEWTTKGWVHKITGTWSVPERPKELATKLVVAHFHCHAPTCVQVSLYDNTTGKLICTEKPIYGGNGKIAERKFDELGYIAQPPCLWGSKEHGLEAPVVVSGRTLHAVKTAYANDGHHGEMAWLQMLYIEEPESATPEDEDLVLVEKLV